MPKFDEVEIYPSPGREKLWGALDEELRELNGTLEKPLIGVTGIKGCGKSHALLRWAKQQMDRGHLVLYVRDAETLCHPGWSRRVYDILHHAAIKLWNLRGLNSEALQRQFSNASPAIDQLEEVWSRLSKVVIPSLLRRGDFEFQFKDLKSLVESAPDGDPFLYSSLLRRLIERVIAVANCAEGSFIQSILIVDEDERLQKAKTEENSFALSASNVISDSPCSLTVLGGDANNERWERVAIRMIHVYPEPVPFEWIGLPHLLPLEVLIKIAKLDPDSVKSVAEARALVPDLFKRLEELTRFFPSELRRFSDFCVRLGGAHVATWELVLGRYEAERVEELRREIGIFIKDQPDRRQAMWKVLKGLRLKENPEMDRRYVSAPMKNGKAEFVTPIAWRAAWEALHHAFGALAKFPRWDGGLEAFYDGKVFLLFLTRDLLRLGRANARIPKLCRDPHALFQEAPNPDVVYVVPPTDPQQPAFNFTLITGTRERSSEGVDELRFCVIFVRCCHGDTWEGVPFDKDSFRDLVQTGDPYWQRMLPPGKCYLGYLWVTPTLTDGAESFELNLARKDVVFRHSKDHAWKSVINASNLSHGRTADYLRCNHRWKGFLSFDEMHLAISDEFPYKAVNESYR